VLGLQNLIKALIFEFFIAVMYVPTYNAHEDVQLLKHSS